MQQRYIFLGEKELHIKWQYTHIYLEMQCAPLFCEMHLFQIPLMTQPVNVTTTKATFFVQETLCNFLKKGCAYVHITLVIYNQVPS